MFETFDDIMTIEELAEAYKIVRTGKIPAFKEGGSRKITKHALTAYVLDRSRQNQH